MALVENSTEKVNHKYNYRPPEAVENSETKQPRLFVFNIKKLDTCPLCGELKL